MAERILLLPMIPFVLIMSLIWKVWNPKLLDKEPHKRLPVVSQQPLSENVYNI
jgi:hypothetical protein